MRCGGGWRVRTVPLPPIVNERYYEGLALSL
jgi:hypothetical protein